MRYISDFLHHFSEKPAFSANEARLFLKRRGASEGYHKLLLEKLYSSGRIYRITRGHYTFYEEVQHVGFAFSPFYYGLEDALSLLNLWEQETNPVVITPRKVRSGIREFRGRNYVVRRIDRSMFFGYIYIKYEKFYISVSAPERPSLISSTSGLTSRMTHMMRSLKTSMPQDSKIILKMFLDG